MIDESQSCVTHWKILARLYRQEEKKLDQVVPPTYLPTYLPTYRSFHRPIFSSYFSDIEHDKMVKRSQYLLSAVTTFK